MPVRTGPVRTGGTSARAGAIPVQAPPPDGAAQPAAARALAAEALRLVQDRPARAEELARAALRGARSSGDAATASVAQRALGLVAGERRDLERATVLLRGAVRTAAAPAHAQQRAAARMSLALVLSHRGRSTAALRELDGCGELTGPAAAQVQMQRALVLQHLGRLDEAIAGYRVALRAFRRQGEQLWEARLLCNRGVAHTYRGSFALAEADLRNASALCEHLQQRLLAAGVRHNLGFVQARRGDVVEALRSYDAAEALYDAEDVPPPELFLDRAELLLQVRLLAEARRDAERGAAVLAAGRMHADLAEARVLLARVALLEGDHTAARRAARQAEAAFTRQGRPGWRAVARDVALQVDAAARAPALPLVRRAARVADELTLAGLPGLAVQARLLGARTALELARPDLAGRALDACPTARRSGPLQQRTAAWHARALLHLAGGDRTRARSDLAAGLDLLDASRAALGALELRAQVSQQGVALARTGLQLALADGDAAQTLHWAERCRAGALLPRPARPPRDEVLADRLADLRAVSQQLADVGLAPAARARLRARQGALEDAVRARSRVATLGPPGAGSAREIPDVPRLTALLGERALVEYAVLDDALHAVVVADGVATLHPLGSAAAAAQALDGIAFALRRLARGGEPAARAGARALLHSCAAALQERLFDGLLDRIGADRPLVVVPTGPLHAVPWSVLPLCRSRPLLVSPSTTLWGAGPRSGLSEPGREPAWETGPGRVVLVAGPDLPHAEAEVRALAAGYPGATTLLPSAATATAVLAELDGAALAHIAAHGTFRDDNPLFSCLGLTDGPLCVYDLDSLERAPTVLVLSGCETGLTQIRPGDELMGLGAALFSLGTRRLVASTVAVRDEETCELMSRLHDLLRAGAEPATALHLLQRNTWHDGSLDDGSGDDSELGATAASFVCFGVLSEAATS